MADVRALLQSEDEESRLQGLSQIADLPPRESLEMLFLGLGDASWRVRKQATELLLERPDIAGLGADLVGLLYDEENAGQRNSAAEVLIRLDQAVISDVLAECKSHDPDVRKFVIDILGSIGGQKVLPALIHALTDSDLNVRAAAAESLGKLGCVTAVPDLLNALDNADLMFRFTIFEALGQIGQRVDSTRLLKYAADPVIRKALFDCLARVGDQDCYDLLLQGLLNDSGPACEAALQALVTISQRSGRISFSDLKDLLPPAALDVVVTLLNSRHRPCQQAAVALLGSTDDGQRVEALLPLLDLPDLQQSVFEALVLVCQRCPDALLDRWEGFGLEVQAGLALVFGRSDCHAAAPFLEETVLSSHRDLSLASASALAEIGRGESFSALESACRNAASEKRLSFTAALARLGRRFPEVAVATAELLLADTDAELRASGVEILASLPGPTVSQQLVFALKDPSGDVRGAALRAMHNRIDNECRGSVLLALTDEVAEVRRLAVELLGELPDQVGLEALQLTLTDEDLWVRAAAARSLGRFGSAGLASLRQLLNDPIGLVVIHALEALVEAEGEASVDALCRALESQDQEVVNTALRLLVPFVGSFDLLATAGPLLLHPSWEVRGQIIQLLGDVRPSGWEKLLHEVLPAEGEEMIRQQIDSLLVSAGER